DALIVVPHKQSYYLDYIPTGQTEAIDKNFDLSVFFFDDQGGLTVLNSGDFNVSATRYVNGRFEESGTQVVTVAYPAESKASSYSVEVTVRQTLNAPSLTLDFPLNGQETRGHTQTGYRVNPPGVGTRPTEYEIWYLKGDANVAHIINPLYPDAGNPRSPIQIQGPVLQMEGLLENIYGDRDPITGNGVFTEQNIYFVVVGKRPNWEPGVSAPVCWRPLAGDIIWLPERLPPADTGYWSFTYLDGDGNSVYDRNAPAIKDQTTSEAPHPLGKYGPAGYYTIDLTGVTVTGKNFGKVIKIPSSSGGLNVTLDNAEINSLTGGSLKYSPLMIGDRASGSSAIVTITLRGDNVLRTLKNSRTEEDYNGRAGLGVEYNSSVTIQGTGSLTAIGGGRAAGIGGWADIDGGTNNCGEIKISSGNVYAFGGAGAAGIGAGAVKNQSTIDGKTISIEGGVVYAFGGPAHFGVPAENLYSAGGAGIGASSTLSASSPSPVTFNGSIKIRGTAVVYAFGGSQARGLDSSSSSERSLKESTALFTFRGVKEGYSSPSGGSSTVEVAAVSLTSYTGGLLFYDTKGSLGGAPAELRSNIVIPPASSGNGDWGDNFWNYSLSGRYIFPAAARAELRFRSSSTGLEDYFHAAYPELTWLGDFHHWKHPVYNPPYVTGPYQLDLAGNELNLQGKTIGIVPKGALEFMDSARTSKADDAAARAAKGAGWTGTDGEKRLLNRDTPTTGFVKNGTILGFNRKGYNNGPNLLPSPGYFFRDNKPGFPKDTNDVYAYPMVGTIGLNVLYCGGVAYTGLEDSYNYDRTDHTGATPPSSGVSAPLLPGDVTVQGLTYSVSLSEGKGYKFFDEVWEQRYFSNGIRPNVAEYLENRSLPSDPLEAWNLFAFLEAEKDSGASFPAEGLFNRRLLKDMNLRIPGVYPWSN
ncbi:MAG: hypothetical protein LBG84_01135, partial [Treponema sp.]|nr:hypothetical protein [Treponema sp.]